MKASVQYNDFVGTAASDISDFYFNALQNFLTETFKSYDGERYSCRGCSAYMGGGNRVWPHFICLDKYENKFVKFSTVNHWSLEEFFNLFKRFEIVIGQDIEEVEIPEADEDLILSNDENA